MPSIKEILSAEAKFREGQRVFVTIGKDDGAEQPEGVVLCPGKVTLIVLDPEWRWPQDDSGLRDIPEEDLEAILDQAPTLQDGALTRRQAD